MAIENEGLWFDTAILDRSVWYWELVLVLLVLDECNDVDDGDVTNVCGTDTFADAR